jgi:hypothetical protein
VTVVRKSRTIARQYIDRSVRLLARPRSPRPASPTCSTPRGTPVPQGRAGDRPEPGFPQRRQPAAVPGIPILIDLTSGSPWTRRPATAPEPPGLPQNEIRPTFVDHLIDGVAEQAVNRIGESWLTGHDLGVPADLAADTSSTRHQNCPKWTGEPSSAADRPNP